MRKPFASGLACSDPWRRWRTREKSPCRGLLAAILRPAGARDRLGDRDSVTGFRCRKRFGELLEALVDFLEGFGARREKPFERDAQVGFEHVFLPLLGFAWIEMI